MKFDKFEDIVAWQKAQRLAVEIYRVFYNIYDNGFKDQIQRAAVSISNNIAEGFERKSNAEFSKFLYIAKGSCAEVRSMIYLAKDLNKIDETQFNNLREKCMEISRMISALIKTL